MPVEGWFETPIYFNFVSDDVIDEIQESISNTISNIKFKKRKDWGLGNHSLSDPTFSENVIDSNNLGILKKEIEQHIHTYIKTFTNHDYKLHLISAWLTKTSPKESTTTHNHGDSDISGVYYFKTNTEDGSIFFLNPLPSLITSNFLASNELVYYKPEVGKLLLFPSWLYHGVRSNDTEEERISLAFNYKVNKE